MNLQMKEQQQIEREIMKLQEIINSKMEENEGLRKKVDNLQILREDDEKMKEMLSEVRRMSEMLQQKNEENEGLRIEMVGYE